MAKYIVLLCSLCFFYLACSPAKKQTTGTNTLAADALKPFGRYEYTQHRHVELISSATHVGFRFEGKECRIFAAVADKASHNYLQYELDGTYQQRVKLSGDNHEPVTITAPDNGAHTVWLYKATEAHTGPVYIEKITGEGLQAVERPDLPLIEFIGNSITCGAAADASEIPCGTGVYHDQHNAYYAYGPRVARLLNTNFILSSVSGIGIYRNWNSDGPTMPQVYERSAFQVEGRPWQFERYRPDIVSIALGTNDFSNGDGQRERLPFDSAAFVGNYIQFVKVVKGKYPQAQIALLSSPMIQGNRRAMLQNCLTAVKQHIDKLFDSDKPVALHFFSPMQPRGCTGHPNVDDHAILAEEVAPFFKDLL